MTTDDHVSHSAQDAPGDAPKAAVAAPPVRPTPRWKRILTDDAGPRRLLVAALLYVLTCAVYFSLAAPQTLTTHTPFNHFALLAEAWLQGRLDLGGPPPPYAQNNDFARFEDKWFVTFPPFPALLLLPLVKLGGKATEVQDGQFFVWLAGLGPAFLFLSLEKLRRMGFGASFRANVVLTVLLAFGTVYFFTAEQGTVWFAAHVVGVALAALYVLFALGAERPVLAGLMLGLGFMTRSPLLFAAPLFVFEALRTSRKPDAPIIEGLFPRLASRADIASLFRNLDFRGLAKKLLWFALPLGAILAVAAWHNSVRFGDPTEFGYRFLTVAWQGRMEKWGLFHYHYLGRNLAVLLTSVPWFTPSPSPVPFQINQHGLALWVTTPLFLWLLWPRRVGPLHVSLWLTTLAVALPTLFYQNTGWIQFGYRFSNDYAVFLICLFAIGGFRMRALFWLAFVWSVAVNSFGAVSFGRGAFDKFYFGDPTQRILHQPD